jgi:hypothetical protein
MGMWVGLRPFFPPTGMFPCRRPHLSPTKWWNLKYQINILFKRFIELYLYQKIGNFPLYPMIPKSSNLVGIEGKYECAKLAHSSYNVPYYKGTKVGRENIGGQYSLRASSIIIPLLAADWLTQKNSHQKVSECELFLLLTYFLSFFLEMKGEGKGGENGGTK